MNERIRSYACATIVIILGICFCVRLLQRRKDSPDSLEIFLKNPQFLNWVFLEKIPIDCHQCAYIVVLFSCAKSFQYLLKSLVILDPYFTKWSSNVSWSLVDYSDLIVRMFTAVSVPFPFKWFLPLVVTKLSCDHISLHYYAPRFESFQDTPDPPRAISNGYETTMELGTQTFRPCQ